ncbi:MAG: hypothetical protein AAGA77_16980 [Bacteroidota bacterium]
MKIRIRDNSIRFRLSATDLKKLRKKGKLVSKCIFGTSQVFKYSVVSKKNGNSEFLCVDLKKNHISIELAASDVKEWVKTDLEGFDAIMDNGTKEGLYVLVEKDWQCLTPRGEDESDLFPNPNA